jgi:hypothetical protein
MKMKKYIILIAILSIPMLVVNSLAVSDLNVGTTAGETSKVGAAGSQFLKIGVGARANAMAGAFTSMADDLTSVHWNPAGLANLKSMNADFSYSQWFGKFSHNFGGLAMPLSEDFTFAASVVSFTSGDIPITTMYRPDGTGASYSVSDFSLNLSLAGYLTKEFSFGVNAKYIHNSFASLSSTGMAFDIGTMYDFGYYGIKLGFSIHNLGTQQTYDGVDLRTTRKLYDAMHATPLDAAYLSYPYNIPIIFRAGISGDVINIPEHKLRVAMDFNTLTDVPEQFAVGAEYVWNDFLALRGGYMLGHDQLGFSGGVGLKYFGGGFGGQIDYAVTPTVTMGLLNRLSVSLNFGG